MCTRVFVTHYYLRVLIIAETASTDKQMSLGDVVIVIIYPHGLVGGVTALFMGLFLNDKVTLTVINLVILRVSHII